MRKYLTRMLAQSELADDRLVEWETRPSGLTVYKWRTGFLHPDLLRDLDELSRHISYAGFLVFKEEGDDPRTTPDVDLWVDTLDPDYLPLQTMTGQAKWTGLHLDFAAIVRADMISRDMLKEFNEGPIKWATNELKPGMPPRSKLILPGRADL